MEQLKTLASVVYMDLKLNCHERPRPVRAPPEIVEVGLLELDPISLDILRESNYLVRPRHEITFRCTATTGLTDLEF